MSISPSCRLLSFAAIAAMMFSVSCLAEGEVDPAQDAAINGDNLDEGGAVTLGTDKLRPQPTVFATLGADIPVTLSYDLPVRGIDLAPGWFNASDPASFDRIPEGSHSQVAFFRIDKPAGGLLSITTSRDDVSVYVLRRVNGSITKGMPLGGGKDLRVPLIDTLGAAPYAVFVAPSGLLSGNGQHSLSIRFDTTAQ